MPFITVELMQGRTLDSKREFAARVTAAAVECFAASPSNVRIRFVTIEPTELATSGVLVADKAAPDPDGETTDERSPTNSA
jgi:4-oxalocrotonate tautomerase